MAYLAVTIHNERTKLTANFLNGAAIALAAIGGFAPTISYLSGGTATSSGILALIASACFVTSIGLHLLARAVLG